MVQRRRSFEPPRPARCHPDRPSFAKGLCKQCYAKEYGQAYHRALEDGTRRKKRAASCHPDRPHYARGLCRACYLELPDVKARRSEYAKRPERKSRERTPASKTKASDNARKAHLKSEFGLTPEDYDRMFAAQGGACAICGKKWQLGQRRLCVDHDHATGAVRGLLCPGCNTHLGFHENLEWHNSADEYLGVDEGDAVDYIPDLLAPELDDCTERSDDTA